jgi:hypothetical protein
VHVLCLHAVVVMSCLLLPIRCQLPGQRIHWPEPACSCSQPALHVFASWMWATFIQCAGVAHERASACAFSTLTWPPCALPVAAAADCC